MVSELAHLWTLDPAVTFLNHGGYGATPRIVLAAQQRWRERMEAEPVRFFARDLEPALDEARRSLAAFVNADPDDVAFVPNATAGVNTVLRSLRFEPGDELLTTDHAYGAARNAIEYVAEREGARVVVAAVPFPLQSPAEVVDAVMGCVTPRTRLAVLDHVTSPTALAFPLDVLVPQLTQRGLDVLVDGAHAPGQLPVSVAALGAAYYVANLHKWVSAPKGAGFLWVRRDRQPLVHPLAISHGATSARSDRSRFRLEFDWTGTSDPSAWLAVPDAIEFGAGLMPGGWDALMARNHRLLLEGRDVVCQALGIEPAAPNEMLGSMASIPLPVARAGSNPAEDLYGDPVHDDLEAHGLQVMVAPWPQRPNGGSWRRLVRISAAAYNDPADYRRLAAALPGAVAAASQA
jgi:isopenicillin-N epimerase